MSDLFAVELLPVNLEHCSLEEVLERRTQFINSLKEMLASKGFLVVDTTEKVLSAAESDKLEPGRIFTFVCKKKS